MNNEVFDKIKNILSVQFGIEPDNITEDKYLVEDLGADSLDIIEIVLELEQQFGIKLEEDEYDHADTVLLITKLVERKLPS